MTTIRPKLREIAQAADPKRALLEAVGELASIEVFHNLVLVATYIEPEKTAGGIIKPDRTLAENRFQGKAALVLQLGPLAFRDDGGAHFGGVTIKVGDWVMVRPSEGWELFKVDASGSAGTSCRMFEDIHIKARLADPASIY
jgi:co-chaperonin GroES (HSP10)